MKIIKNTEMVCKRMNIRNHLYALFPLMFFTLIISIGVYLFYLRYGIPDSSIKSVLILLYSIFAIPVLFLHFEYIIHDFGVSLIIDNKNKSLIYRKGKYETVFSLDEIESVCFFGETKDFNNLTTQNHSFYLFKLNNEKHFIVTCLVIRDIESVLFKIDINKNRRLFPSILFEDVTKKCNKDG